MTVVFPTDVPVTPEEEEYFAEMYPDEAPDHYDEDVFNEFETDCYY
jgi:hypothetical protein